MPEDQARRSGAQHVHVIDRVRPGEHPVHQRHHLATRQRRARQPGVEPHRLVHQLLDPQPVRERRVQQAGVADQPLLVERHAHRVQVCRPGNVRTVMHHMGDLLTGPRLPHTIALKSLLRRTFKPQARTEPTPLRGGSRVSARYVAVRHRSRLGRSSTPAGCRWVAGWRRSGMWSTRSRASGRGSAARARLRELFRPRGRGCTSFDERWCFPVVTSWPVRSRSMKP